ncbi:DUF1071 domain-containing protein [Staphylococcus gallinarum]|uniref:Sak single strand annealing protein n=1 Tax=Staphylococcus gallinarum TaxID=1293 RepID=UPI001C1F44F4|nr:DUF1071 domain-containing protein [Staphylococcus gallinarum]MBU7218396.1 DUF1071 domain-containing protein [Staphylococcus gallinarum]
MSEKTLFEQLNTLNVSDHVEKKNGFNYLAWTHAHEQLKNVDPNYEIKIHEFPHPDIANDQVFVPYLATPEGYFVKVSITLKGITESEWLPVLDFKNKSLSKGQATTFDINKAQKRCFVKAAALHGLGLYIYSGEELPNVSSEDAQDLESRMNEFVRISQEKGRDATLDKTMRWLGIENINKLSGKELAKANAKLDAGLKQLDKENE